jgi:hypothetical protein
MSKGSAPKAPDYVGAAQLQGELSKEALNMQNYANRPTQNTPFGSTSWNTKSVVDPATGQEVTQWTQNTSLAPELQNALNSQLGLQQDRSNLASGFMDRVGSEYAKPFDWQNLPQMAQAAGPGQLQSGITDYTRGITTSAGPQQNAVGGFNFGGPQMGVSSMGGDVQRGVSQTGVNTGFSSMTGNLAGRTGTEGVQRGLSTGDNPALPTLNNDFRNQVANDLMSQMAPVQRQQQQALETDLSNRGFKVGTAGYQRAMDELNQRQAGERYNALGMAGQEAQRLYGMQMGARQQAFNEDVTGGQFANQAANQAFSQGLAANQFQNQAAGQAFQQDMAARQAQNQALGQQFSQGLAAGQFGNQATQQAFNQALQAGQFGNQAQQQLYGQMMGQADLANRASAQNFGQNLAAAQFQNQALGQAQGLDLARMQAGNQAAQQQFNMNQSYANQQNQLRQQAIAEQMQRRGMSLNEMNALLTGQQVGMPQMPNFSQSGRAETPNILGATQMGYNAAMDQYNAQQAGFGNTMGGLFSLGSAAISNPFMFSDRRLKRRIKRIGTHESGVGIYEFDMAGYRQRGVIAQEVAAVRPDLVKRHASGYLTVNYSAL